MSDTGVIASRDDLALAERLRAGDERAFMMLVELHQAAMLRIARMYVSSSAVAEEVVQEAWLGVVRGIDRFEGRSSLRTWIFRIVMNLAKTRGAAERRSVPFSSLAGDDVPNPGIDPTWFEDAGGRQPAAWKTPPSEWSGIPEDRLVGQETLGQIGRAIETLPPMQAEVIRLRDVLGWSSDEVCNALDLTQTNQRVLLHRARTTVRHELDGYLKAGSEGR